MLSNAHAISVEQGFSSWAHWGGSGEFATGGSPSQKISAVRGRETTMRPTLFPCKCLKATGHACEPHPWMI